MNNLPRVFETSPAENWDKCLGLFTQGAMLLYALYAATWLSIASFFNDFTLDAKLGEQRQQHPSHNSFLLAVVIHTWVLLPKGQATPVKISCCSCAVNNQHVSSKHICGVESSPIIMQPRLLAKTNHWIWCS